MAIRKSRINHKLLLYAQTQSYNQLKATMIAIAVAGLTAVTVPTFVLVQPAFAREAILMVQRSLQGGNPQKPNSKLDGLMQELALLEVEKALLDGKVNPNHRDMSEITNKITTLQNQLNQISAKISDKSRSHAFNRNVKETVINAITDQIVALEIERSQLEINHHPQSEVIKFTDEQIRNLRRRIIEIDAQNPKETINTKVENALLTKITQLSAKRNEFSRAYTLDDIEEIFNLDLQLRSLEQRIAIYRAN